MTREKRTAPVLGAQAAAALSETNGGQRLVSDTDSIRNRAGFNSPNVTLADDLQELKRKAQAFDCIKAVTVDQPEKVKPLDRLAAVVLVIEQTERKPDPKHKSLDGYPVTPADDIASGEVFGKRLGVGRNAALQSMTRLATTGVIEYKAPRQWYNSKRQPLNEGVKGNPDRGDYCITEPSLSIPVWPAEELAARLARTAGTEAEQQQKDKERKKAEREKAEREKLAAQAEIANLKRKIDEALAGKTCPHCNEVGHLRGEIVATCDSCGAQLTPDELIDAWSESDRRQPAPPDPADVIDPVATRRRNLRGLAGIDTPPAPGIDYQHFQDDGIIVEVKQQSESDPYCLEQSESDRETETLIRWALPSIADDDVLTGADTLTWFAYEGGDCFTLAERHSKEVKERDWPRIPHTLDEARAHLAAGKNVGWRGAGAIVLLDTDQHAGEYMTRVHMPMTGTNSPAFVFRSNAPDRLKVAVRCTDPENLKSRKYKTEPKAAPVFEVLAAGAHGVIAGIHESGATIALHAGDVPEMTAAEIEAMALRWLDHKYPATEYPEANWRATPIGASSEATGKGMPALAEIKPEQVDKLPYALQMDQAIAWFNSDERNQQAAIQYAQKAYKGRGKYVAMRPDDRTPSTYQFSADAFVDYGEWAKGGAVCNKRNGVTDAFELHCEANSDKSKKRHIFETINAWRKSIGARPIPDKTEAAR